jgi:hypothetical protein
LKRERLILKRPSGWFAADQSFVEALELLSEGAFKLYVYACLQADRHTGRIVLEHARITRVLRQCPDRIVRHLNELTQCGVFHVNPGIPGGEVALIEIRDRFWPYRKQPTGIRPGSEQACFIGAVRDLFLAPACVGAVFKQPMKRSQPLFMIGASRSNRCVGLFCLDARVSTHP